MFASVCGKRGAIFRLLSGLLLGLLVWGSPVYAASVLEIHSKLSHFKLQGHLQTFYDPSGALALDQVISMPFTDIDGNLSAGYRSGRTWLKFVLQPRAEVVGSTWWLNVKPATIDEMTLYQRDADGRWQSTRRGDTLPFADRAVKHRTSVFEIAFENTEPQTFYLSLQSTSNVAANPTL